MILVLESLPRQVSNESYDTIYGMIEHAAASLSIMPYQVIARFSARCANLVQQIEAYTCSFASSPWSFPWFQSGDASVVLEMQNGQVGHGPVRSLFICSCPRPMVFL